MASIGTVTPQSMFFADALPLQSGARLARLHAGVRDLRHAQCRAQQCRAGVPCAQRQPPCRRQLCRRSPTTSAGGTTWSARASRWTPTSSSSSASTTPAPASAAPGRRARTRDQPGQPYGADFPVVTVEDWVDAQARLLDAPGHHAAGRGDRRQPGRHAGAGLDAALSRARAPLHRRRHRAQPVGAEHRLQRGGAPRHRHRPRLPRRPLPAPRRRAQARAARGAHDGPHHLPVRRRRWTPSSAAQLRAPSRPTARRRSSSRSKATCATRPTSSASTSTPTPTC